MVFIQVVRGHPSVQVITSSIAIQSNSSMHHYECVVLYRYQSPEKSILSQFSGFIHLQIQGREIALYGLHPGSTWPHRWASSQLLGGGSKWLGWRLHSHSFSQHAQEKRRHYSNSKIQQIKDKTVAYPRPRGGGRTTMNERPASWKSSPTWVIKCIKSLQQHNY